MINNHLIIGLGGTGGKILRSLRKTIYQNFRSEDPSGVNIRYLYVDSSDEMMAHDDSTWKILGQSVQLKRTSQLKISALNLAQVLDNLGSYPGISPWLGSRETFRNILSSANAANIIGGQKRRLGRFLFACYATQFRNQVDAFVKEMETGGIASVTFHVCCGLAGGTGSGCVVDVVSQIREAYRDKKYRIVVYALIPDKNPGANRAQANYHANGYAALMELNALSIGAFKPHDVSGRNKERRLDLQDTFNCCYLFSDENEDHNRVDLDKELPEIVSSFLYQKIVAAKDMSWDSLRRLETFENMDFRPEESPFGHKPERSRLFFAFGIKQIAYPEEEIREYLTYAFARQAALQLQFNHWTDSVGYSEDPVNQSFNEFVRLKETLQRWYLTDEHLTLSEGILPDEIKNKRWKPINIFWVDLIPNFKSHVRESYANNDRVWLDELSKLCEAAYSQNYRDFGVRKFYETKGGEIKDHVRELRGRIERDLFQDWMNGEKSMYDISRLLSALVASLEERLKLTDDRISKQKEGEESFASKVAFNAKEWAKVGVISGWLGKRQNLLNAQGECLQQLYIYRTRIAGMEFSKKLIQALVADLTILGAEVSRCTAMIVDSTKDFNESIDARCADSGQADLQKPVIRFYHPDTVKDFTKSLVRDRTAQQKQSGTVRIALAALLGEAQNFTNFNARISKEKFIDVLESTCVKNATDAHNNYVAANRDLSRILQVSIIERLYREYAGNRDALRSYVISVVSRAKNYLCFNDLEVKRQGSGTAQGGFVSYLSIILPEAPDLAEFHSALRSEFENATTGAKEIVLGKDKPHEITLVSITNLFPVRFVKDVAFLREKYEQRITANDADQARMELHLEGDGSGLPNLFVGDVEPKKFLAYLLLAKAMDVVQLLEDPDTGLKNLYLLTKNEKGRENAPILLGKSMDNALQQSSLETYDALIASVDPLLAKEFLHAKKREELSISIQSQLNEVRAERKNPLDRTYRLFAQAAETAESILAPRE